MLLIYRHPDHVVCPVDAGNELVLCIANCSELSRFVLRDVRCYCFVALELEWPMRASCAVLFPWYICTSKESFHAFIPIITQSCLRENLIL